MGRACAGGHVSIGVALGEQEASVERMLWVSAVWVPGSDRTVFIWFLQEVQLVEKVRSKLFQLIYIGG